MTTAATPHPNPSANPSTTPRPHPGTPITSGAEPGFTLAGVLLAVGTLALWTVTPLLVTYFTNYLDQWTSNGWRYGIAGLVMCPVLINLARQKKWPRNLWRRAAIPAVFSAAAQVCFVGAFYQIGPGQVTFGLRAQMVCVAIGAAILFPAERRVVIKPAFIAGTLAVVLGTLGVAWFDPERGQAAEVRGMLLAVGAGLGYGCYGLAVRKFMADVNPITAYAAISQPVALVMIVLMLLLGDRHGATGFDLTLGQWPVLILSVFTGLVVGHIVYFAAMRSLGVAAATGVLQLQPLTVGVVSMVVFGEVLKLPQWACGFVAIGGAITMLVVQHHAHRRGQREPIAEACVELD